MAEITIKTEVGPSALENIVCDVLENNAVFGTDFDIDIKKFAAEIRSAINHPDQSINRSPSPHLICRVTPTSSETCTFGTPGCSARHNYKIGDRIPLNPKDPGGPYIQITNDTELAFAVLAREAAFEDIERAAEKLKLFEATTIAGEGSFVVSYVTNQKHRSDEGFCRAVTSAAFPPLRAAKDSTAH